MRGKPVKAGFLPGGTKVYLPESDLIHVIAWDKYGEADIKSVGGVAIDPYGKKVYLAHDSMVYVCNYTSKPQAGKLLQLKSALRALVSVMDYGDKQHDPGSWKNNNWQHHVDKALRHLLLYEGEKDESGMDHLWHALCNMAFAVELKERENATGTTPTS